ncbi:MAG TPA: hypothetical protein VNT22_08885 [Baekduia sp.]|nr:hypothetical protein [Baekduia sp.]
MSRHVHLVGSINLPSTEAVFTTVGECLGDHITRIPDGEVGERNNWSAWGAEQLHAHPAFVEGDPNPFGPVMLVLREPEKAAELEVAAPGYAAHAKSSYEIFRKLRDEGSVPKDARFLVALPTPFAWLGYVDVPQRALVESVLEKATLDDVREICESIPSQDLAIQWDVSNEFGILEKIEASHWGDDLLGGLADRIARMIDAIPNDVEVGLHLCYGSYEDKHFVEPKDADWMVKLLNTTLDRTSRKLAWVHMPVPIERDDAEYFAPLAELKRDRFDELFLGLVHIEDGLEGSARRIAAAKTVTDDFGVATECGVARLDEAEMEPLLKLQAQTADLDDLT